MSTYVGLYVQRLSDGTIYNVQVRDAAGIELPLTPEQYRASGIRPELESLPDVEAYRTAQ